VSLSPSLALIWIKSGEADRHNRAVPAAAASTVILHPAKQADDGRAAALLQFVIAHLWRSQASADLIWVKANAWESSATEQTKLGHAEK